MLVRVRGRAAGGAAVAVALLVSVVLLRDQVEPTEAARGPAEPPAPTATTVAPDVLPARPVEPAPQWLHYQVPPGAVRAVADPGHVLFWLGGQSAEPLDGSLLVQARDGSGASIEYRPTEPGWAVVNALVLDHALYTVELAWASIELDNGDVRLNRVDLATGLVRPVPVRPVGSDRSLLSVGDELVTVGLSGSNPSQYCVVAIQPGTGAQRSVVCGPTMPVLTAADGGVLITQPDGTQQGCTVRLLAPGRGEFGVPVSVGSCGLAEIVVVGDWHARVTVRDSPTVPLVLVRGDQRLLLGPTKLTAVPCHGWLYWVAGGQDRSRLGLQVRRWRPGPDLVEIVHSAAPGTRLGQPVCADGTLTVSVYDVQSEQARLTALLVLDRP
jgi:hypothetical protein